MLHRTVDIYVHVLNAMSGPSWAAQLLPEQDLGDAGAGGRHHLPRVPPHQRAGPGQTQEAAAVQLQSVRIPPPVYCDLLPPGVWCQGGCGRGEGDLEPRLAPRRHRLQSQTVQQENFYTAIRLLVATLPSWISHDHQNIQMQICDFGWKRSRFAWCPFPRDFCQKWKLNCSLECSLQTLL